MEDSKALSLIEKYLNRNSFKEILFETSPQKDLQSIIVIPVYNELGIEQCVNSILNAQPPLNPVEIIIIVNSSVQDDEAVIRNNQNSILKLEEIKKSISSESIKLLFENVKELPVKHAGVGLARKIGMDEALRRFHKIRNPYGQIICLDADCNISANYLRSIQNYSGNAASVYFEHPFENQAIVFYELFLRYYVNALRFAGYPFAFHTIGSSMMCNAISYAKEGGMNRRKAAEDFYFIHKHIPLEGFGEINDCIVYPEARESDRVPFGTGKAIADYRNDQSRLESIYSFKIFIDLKDFFEISKSWNEIKFSEKELRENYHLWPESIKSFIGIDEFLELVEESRINSGSRETFNKRIFQWLNAFKILKLIHHIRDNHYPNGAILDECMNLLKEIDFGFKKELKSVDLLEIYRTLDRKQILLDQIIKI